MTNSSVKATLSVGIVGAGFAGLRCADVLLQKGCKVTIFEARDRLGGRVAQSRHLGHLIDLGPNWIHGSDKNPVVQIARQSGTTLHNWNEPLTVFDTDGTSLDAEETKEYEAFMWDDGLIKEAFEYSRKNTGSIDPEKSLYDFVVERTQDWFQHEPAQNAKVKRDRLLKFTRTWGAYVGSPVTQQSLKFFWLEEGLEGENPFVAETYHKILDEVARCARESADVRLETKVTGIVSNTASRPVVETDYGAKEQFDVVVVTCPLGWLKLNQHTFKPALPNRISQAIDNIGYGTLDKVYITFPSAFWETGLPSRSRELTNAKEKRQAGDTLWLSPTYTLNTNPEGWDLECLSLTALPKSCAHPTLLFYVYGPCSKHIADFVSRTSNEDERHSRIVEFFEPYYSRLRNYNKADPDCTPKASVATAWANDELAGCGSYSNFQIGLENGDKDIEAMRQGMPERRIWFAGEHTAPFEDLGSATGAYLSGERAADKIVKTFEVDSS